MISRALMGLCVVAAPLACAFEESATSVGATLSGANSSSNSGESSSTAVEPTTTDGEHTSSSASETGTTTDDTSSSTSHGHTSTTETTTTGATSSSTSDATSSSTTDETSSASGTTEPPAPTCDDGLMNQDETATDCGGSCSPCPDGQACLVPADCASTWCDAGLCATPECLTDDDCLGLAGPCLAALCAEDSKTCATEPSNEGMGCDDDDLCTQTDTCSQGQCTGADPVDCSGLDSFCGMGVCAPQTGLCELTVKPNLEGQACDDGFVCTPDDTCQASGLCGPGGPGYQLFEDFSGAAPGWTLGMTWEIGPAMPSPPGPTGADPEFDHSPGDDNRLAGVLIGGLSEGGPVAKTCLTSPAVDTTGHPTAWVTYWRHLHTDYFPFVLNQVEVFDGIDWVEVEIGYDNPGVNDPNWQQIAVDVGPYSNEALQLRICYERFDAVAFAGWSVDDVTIGEYACTPE